MSHSFNIQRGRQSVLVATNCASRGLDVKDIAVVINFDLPKDSSEYIHRLGILT